MHPGLEIPFKSEKITKNRILKKVGFQKIMKGPVFHAESEFQAQIVPNRVKKPILTHFLKNAIFWKISKNRWAAASAGGLLNKRLELRGLKP